MQTVFASLRRLRAPAPRRTGLLLTAAVACAALPAPAAEAARGPVIDVLSNRADLLSGGDALVAVGLPKGVAPSAVRVRLGRRDVTRAFAMRPDGRFAGLVGGLHVGRNVLRAVLRDGRGARIVLTDHPDGGPLFGGLQLQPWTCQKTARDAQCNEPPTYTYLYRSTDPVKAGLQPYDPAHPASDVATTRTDGGVTVPFIVRVETGYQDRDQYKILTLFTPGGPWSRWAPQPQWNHKVLIPHGGNCGADRRTGTAPLDDFSGTIPTVPGYTESYINALGRGFAVMSTAMDNTGHNCNVATEAESLIMAKERLVEQYGDIRYTIGTGCSGGSIAQQTVANAYPGAVYDGLIVTCAYPDTLTAGAQFADFHLLRHYFEDLRHIDWNPLQWAAVEGHPNPGDAIVADEGLFQRATNPSTPCVVKDLYNAVTNPGGVRCSIIDHSVNIFGPRPQSVWTAAERRAGHGFAGLPLGNAGIQYGLKALKAGIISPAQFVDLNAKIGGLSVDIQPQAARTTGDPTAVANAYRSGMIDEANNLAGVAIIDHAGPDPGAAHDYAHTWWMRDRLDRALGNHRNHVLWFGPVPLVGNLNWPTEALVAMDRWLAAVTADGSARTRAQKIVDDKPADINDRCEYVPDVSLGPVDDLCLPPAAQTRFGTPRQVAGGDEANDVVTCALRPLRRADYPPTLTDAQFAQLQRIFPTGVCDWSRPGLGQQPTVPWLTYQDAKGRVIYGGRPMGPPPRSHAFRLHRRHPKGTP